MGRKFRRCEIKMTESNELIISAIYLKGDNLVPKYISSVIGLIPDRCQQKGGAHFSGGHAIAKVGMWALFSKSHSEEIIDHVESLLESFTSQSIVLRNIEGVEEAYLDIFVGSDLEENEHKSLKMVFGNNTLSRLSKLGLEVRISISVGKDR